jgi:hypothetical protein
LEQSSFSTNFLLKLNQAATQAKSTTEGWEIRMVAPFLLWQALVPLGILIMKAMAWSAILMMFALGSLIITIDTVADVIGKSYLHRARRDRVIQLVKSARNFLNLCLIFALLPLSDLPCV